jgi:gamma-glutamylputrescine oxidase
LPEELAKAINPQDLAVYDTRFVLDYYRLTADRRLLFGSGTNYSGRETPSLDAALRPAIEKTFPQLKGIRIDFAWHGQDGISLNRIPQLGRVADNVFYAQGYSGHGVATSHIVGEVMAKALSGDPRELDIFAAVRHWRLPVGRYLGNQALALGMWYFQMRENWR